MTIIFGNAIDLTAGLEPGSVQQVTTSPPYWSQRRYGDNPGEELGWGSLDEYLADMGRLLDLLHRACDAEATMWWVIGDKMSGCVDESTEALTGRGWLRYDEIVVGDSILTWSETLQQPEWGIVQRMNIHPSSEREMLVIDRERGHSSVTTLDHRWLTERRTGRTRRFEWKWTTSDGLTTEDRVPIAGKVANLPLVKTIDDAMVELVAWHYTEGHDRKNRDGSLGGIIIGQSPTANPRFTERIARCLGALWEENGEAGHGNRWRQHPPTWSQALVQPGLIHFRLNSTAAALVREHTGDEKVPSTAFLTALTQDQLELFIETSIAADGAMNKGTWAMTQTVKERVDALQMAAQLAGVPTTITGPHAVFRSNGDKVYDCQDKWVIQQRTSQNIKPLRSGARREIRDGIVWCPTTNNSTWLARRDGYTFFTGNSGGAGGDHLKKGSKNWIAAYGKPDYGSMASGQHVMVPFRFAEMAQERGWLVRSIVVWDKSPNVKPEDMTHTNRPMFSHEYIIVLAKQVRHRFYPKRLVEKGNVWHITPHRGSKAKRHYAPFPEEIPRRAILASTRRGDLVLDPFVGSGTTVDVATDLGRRALGYELYPPEATSDP